MTKTEPFLIGDLPKTPYFPHAKPALLELLALGGPLRALPRSSHEEDLYLVSVEIHPV